LNSNLKKVNFDDKIIFMRKIFTTILFILFCLINHAQNLLPIIQCASGSGSDNIIYFNQETKEIYIQTNSNDGFYASLPSLNNNETRFVKYKVRGDGTFQYINSINIKTDIVPLNLQNSNMSYMYNASDAPNNGPYFYQYKTVDGIEYEIINGDTSYSWPNTKLFVDIYDNNMQLTDSNVLLHTIIHKYGCDQSIRNIKSYINNSKIYFFIEIVPGMGISCGENIPYHIASVYNQQTKDTPKILSNIIYSYMHPFFLNNQLYVYSFMPDTYLGYYNYNSFCYIDKYDSNDSLIKSKFLIGNNYNQSYYDNSFYSNAFLFDNRIIIQPIGLNDIGIISSYTLLSIDTSSLDIIDSLELNGISHIYKQELDENMIKSNNVTKAPDSYIFNYKKDKIKLIGLGDDVFSESIPYYEIDKNLSIIFQDSLTSDEMYEKLYNINMDENYNIYISASDSIMYRLNDNNDTLWKNFNPNFSSITGYLTYYRNVLPTEHPDIKLLPFFSSTYIPNLEIYYSISYVYKLNIETGEIIEELMGLSYNQDILNSSYDYEFPNNEFFFEDIVGNVFLISNTNALCSENKDIQTSKMFKLLNIDSLNTIYTKAFFDYNANNIQDANEPIFNKASVKVTKNNNILYYTYLNADGTKSFIIDTGNYTIQLMYQDNLFAVNPTSKNINFNTYKNNDTTVFALQPIGNITDASISLVNTFITRPGNETTYLLTVNNKGNQAISQVRVAVKLDANLTVQNTSLPYTTNGDSLIFNINTLHAAQIQNISIRVLANTALIFNDILHNYVIASTNVVETDLLNNVVVFDDVVRGSYDPNDKTASASNLPNLAAQTNNITYTIRFENTGNDTAFNVVVRDTLSNNVDWSTLEIINVSHNYTLNIEQDSILVFVFKNILLSASSHNNDDAHGYIVYEIKPNVQNANTNYDINNTAHIIFDYNKPVTTNTANTKVEQVLKTKHNEALNKQLLVYPNTADEVLNVDVSMMNIKNYTLQLLDVNGRVVYKKNEDKTLSKINVSTMANGMYILNVKTEIGNATKKVLIKH
jgi:uncharacterized repeat protein (TIGR01451 family)